MPSRLHALGKPDLKHNDSMGLTRQRLSRQNQDSNAIREHVDGDSDEDTVRDT